jgi:hypothetical protein
MTKAEKKAYKQVLLKKATASNPKLAAALSKAKAKATTNVSKKFAKQAKAIGLPPKKMMVSKSGVKAPAAIKIKKASIKAKDLNATI